MTEHFKILFLFVIKICLGGLFHGYKIIFIFILFLLYYIDLLYWKAYLVAYVYFIYCQLSL